MTLQGFCHTLNTPRQPWLSPNARKDGSWVLMLLSCLQVAVLDGSNQKVPTGKIGEVCIRGPNVTAGYLSNPSANQEAFAGMRPSDFLALIDMSCTFVSAFEDRHEGRDPAASCFKRFCMHSVSCITKDGTVPAACTAEGGKGQMPDRELACPTVIQGQTAASLGHARVPLINSSTGMASHLILAGKAQP